MNNDILYFLLCLVIFLIVVGIVFVWVRASSKMLQVKENKDLQGIYLGAGLNERCSDGAPPTNTSILLPGFETPPPCRQGYKCFKLSDDAPYGNCKADLGTECYTVYDCAPLVGPTGGLYYRTGGATGITGILVPSVFCNKVCSIREFGNVLEGCEINLFPCDANQDLVCNNITKPTDNSKCLSVYENPCDIDEDCFGGICSNRDGFMGKVCSCPGPETPVNLKVCLYLDGQKCKSNQECYGGICYRPDPTVGEFGVCQTNYLPGKYCESDTLFNDFCLSGYSCDFSLDEQMGICQPDITTSTGTSPAQTEQINSLCTSYNDFTGYTPLGPTGPTGIFPIITCDETKELECNYDLTTRGPVGYPARQYLKGFGTCQKATAKLGQPCDKITACIAPGVCIQDNNGQGICSRPQYFDENDILTIYINNPTTENLLINNANSLTGTFPEIVANGYDTMLVQLVGAGGGGNFGYQGLTGFYGAGGGGSGKVIGYVDAGPSETGAIGPATFYYQNTNAEGLYPLPYLINLNSFDWDDIKLTLGEGGTNGIESVRFAGQGGNTNLEFYNQSNPVLTLSATGGEPGTVPFGSPIIFNGNGGTGYNGGGAAAGGYSKTTQSFGGAGDVLIGGANGTNALANSSGAELSGNGGGIGAGAGGGIPTLNIFQSSEGGGGAAGSMVFAKDEYGKLIRTGGDGASAILKNNNTTQVVQALPGLDYTGAGAGGGAKTVNNIIANGATGGKGYAIFKFLKLNKNINFAGTQSKNISVPASGSSGKCATGYVSNGLYQIDSNGPNFCIPKQGYTCNTSNNNFPGGSLCMNSGNTTADGICGSGIYPQNYKLGIYIPTPPNLGTVNNENYLGKWHFANLPEQPSALNERLLYARLSVYQYMDNSDVFYPRTRIIFFPLINPNILTINYTYFYYADFSVKDISPNNPLNLTDITLNWYKITVQPSSVSNTLNYIIDIKFTSAGNIALIVNETADLNFPLTPSNPVASSVVSKDYTRMYYCDITTDLILNPGYVGTLTYPVSNLGPIFCAPGNLQGDSSSYSLPASNIDSMYFNDYSKLPYDKFIWDVDDLVNKSVCFVFLNNITPSGGNFNIFSSNYTVSPNELSSLSLAYTGNFSVIDALNQIYTSMPKSIKYYSYQKNGFSLNIQDRFIWSSLSSNGRTNKIYINTPSTPISLNLEENTEQVCIDLNFNRIIDLEFFDFYYAVLGDKYKYTSVSYDPINSKFDINEEQLDGYLPTVVANGERTQEYMSISNLDRSMYMLVQTCE